MVLSVMLPSCGMRTGGDTFTENDIQRYLNLENEKGMFLRIKKTFFFVENLSTRNKVGCVFPMVVVSIPPHAGFWLNYHRDDAPHFIASRWTNQAHLQCTVDKQHCTPQIIFFDINDILPCCSLQCYLYPDFRYPVFDKMIVMRCYRYRYSHFYFIMSVASADRYLDLYLSKSIFNFSI